MPMTRRDDIDNSGQAQREQTDESLRVERDKADTRIAAKRDVAEQQADAVVSLARQRADEITQNARDQADRDGGPRSSKSEDRAELARAQADTALDHERSIADQLLEDEREARKRHLGDFLALEREATDNDLIGERAHIDTVIAGRDEFLATVSHDLRSLLSGLAFNAARLGNLGAEGPAGDEVRKQAVKNQRMVSRMNRLVGDLLDVTSIEAGQLALHMDGFVVADILRDLVDAFEPIAAAKGVKLEIDAEGDSTHAQLDSERIFQALANLVSNAIKFTPADGRIIVRFRATDEELHFAVTDTGIGIAADVLAAVFERFRQVSSDRRGHGLGLHIAKHIVEGHGGVLSVESTPGAGSSFHFTVPTGIITPGA